MSKEPLQHFPAEHISQCVNKAVESTGNPGKNIKFPGSECTHSFHQACLRWQWQKLQKPWPRAGSRARFPVIPRMRFYHLLSQLSLGGRRCCSRSQRLQSISRTPPPVNKHQAQAPQMQVTRSSSQNVLQGPFSPSPI